MYEENTENWSTTKPLCKEKPTMIPGSIDDNMHDNIGTNYGL